jgi:hypothetical protein
MLPYPYCRAIRHPHEAWTHAGAKRVPRLVQHKGHSTMKATGDAAETTIKRRLTKRGAMPVPTMDFAHAGLPFPKASERRSLAH